MSQATIATHEPHTSAHPLRDDPLGLLTAAVRVATGNPHASARTGQAALRVDIDAALQNRGAVVAVAPTGSGKSLATLTAAFMAAINDDERTVLSTDSLALMGQLQDKDVDTVQTAALELFPEREVVVAFVKGVANYVDPAKVIGTAQILLGSTVTSHEHLAEEMEKASTLRGLSEFGDIGDESAFKDLIVWALRQYTKAHSYDSGDRHTCPVEHTAAAWATVSSSASEADDGAAYGVTSKAQLAKDAASAADIIITNHSILAVQAAHGLPIIVGSTRYGHIDHIIIDEAHTLPGNVRAQGAAKISGRSVQQIARQAFRAASSPGGPLRSWNDTADRIASYLDETLRAFLAGTRDGVKRMGENDNPVGDIASTILSWLDTGQKALAPYSDTHDVTTRIKVTSALDRIDSMKSAVKALQRHRSGWARWVEREDRADGWGKTWIAANVSPINVGWLLNDNLWTATGEDGETYQLSVVALSATLPVNYPYQAGLNAQRKVYQSPFAEAYAGSALFIPQITDPTEVGRLTKPGYGGKQTFDVSKHPAWAADMIIELVRANGGRALVLAAKAADGKLYAERLRTALPHLTVHSQWDGGATGRIANDWRDDETSVLVGTKTYMTGIDAKGRGNSLVIVDRIPRSPSNPIDDARVEEIQARTGDRWAADRMVYAVDATLLLEQAIGRLIRSETDRGMAVVLDPRLLKAPGGRPGPITYPEPTRKVYMEPLYAYGQKMTDRDSAIAWLQNQHR